MKILAISNLYPPDVIGGYELCCQQVVDGLRARGHEVRVLTTIPRAPCRAAEGVLRKLELVNCYDLFDKQHGQPVTEMVGLARAASASAQNVFVLLDQLRQFGPDVAYLWNLFGIGGLGLLACLQHQGVPWTWYLGDCVPKKICSLGDEVLPGLAEMLGRYARGAFMPVSQRVVDEIEAAGVRLNGPVRISPNWIVGPQPAPRQEYYRPGDQLRIVSAGQLGRHKGIDLLIEAAARLRSRGFQNFHIDLFGKLMDQRLASLPTEYQVDDMISFKGVCPQDELIGRYARHEYDLFAFPTWRREPFGCAALEAAAYGIVVLMSDDCGLGEWLVGDVHCLKSARTADAFADTLAGVLAGSINLRAIGRRASAVVWRDFQLGRLLPEIESVLARSAQQAGSPGPGQQPDDAYRLALLAEKLAKAWVQERTWLPVAA